MSWLVPALLAPAVYTTVVYIDKYIVSKQIRDYQVVPIYTAIAGTLAGFLLWIANGFPLLSPGDTVIVLAAGILTLAGLFFYYKAMSSTEASKVILLTQIIPVLILIGAYVFLGETINLWQLYGFLLILIAVLAISLEKTRGGLELSPALFSILLVDLMWAASSIVMKFAIDTNSFSKVISFQNWGLGIGGAILYLIPSVHNSFHKSLRTTRGLGKSLIFVNEGIYLGAKATTFFAYSLAPVALVSILEGTQVFWGILYGLTLTIFVPRVFKEDVSHTGLLKKIVWSIVLLIGIIFINQ